MTPEEINIAIAKACGWTNFRPTVPKRGSLIPRFTADPPYRGDRKIIPDYCNSLDAMHEAEKNLCNIVDMQPSDFIIYEGILMETCGRFEFHFNATASQRAEAFLKTIGKWKSKPSQE